MYVIGGRAHARGITFQSDAARVYAAEDGKDTVKIFSPKTRALKAALRGVPFLRVFPAFGKTGTVLFLLLAALLLIDIFTPWLLFFEIDTGALVLLLLGSFMILLFVLIFLRKRIKRTLQYHGAEHMALNTYRSTKPLTAENIARADRATASCGSVFALIFLILALPLMFAPYGDYLVILAFLIAFEVTMIARRGRHLRPLLNFGMKLQRKIWTREPDEAQIETARRGLIALIGIMDKENL